MGACPITRFPLLQADLPAPVESLILCAEVRAGDGGSAVIIAVTPVSCGIGVAPLLSLIVGNTLDANLSIEYKWEDTGTAGVRTRHSVAAGFRLSPNPGLPGLLTERCHGSGGVC